MTSLFGQGAFGTAGVQGGLGGQPQQAAETTQQPPPASKKFIESLAPKAVTEDDIQESNNKECRYVVCMYSMSCVLHVLLCTYHLFVSICLRMCMCLCPVH